MGTDDLKEIVLSAELEYFPREVASSEPWSGDLFDDVTEFEREHGIHLNMIRKGIGGYTVRVMGRRDKVLKCIATQWGTNESLGSAQQLWFAEGLLGDELAEHRWSTGCTNGVNLEAEEARAQYLILGEDGK